MDSSSENNRQQLLAPIDLEIQPEAPEETNGVSWYFDKDEREDTDEENFKKRLQCSPSKKIWKLLETPTVMSEILSRLPLKSVCIFKCVSKKIMNELKLVTEQFVNTRGAVTGFFGLVSYSFDDFDIAYIDPKKDLDALPDLPDPSLEFVKQTSKSEKVRLLDSCNGLLLCLVNNKSVTTFVVCNPLTKQVVALPQCNQRFTRANYALIADLDENGYLKYKVVLLFRQKGRNAWNLLIFLSVTGEWEEIKANFPEMHHPTMMESKVYFKGTLFWDCFEGYIFACHFDTKSRNIYELIEAPRAPLGRCLWIFNEKLLCYCHGYEGEFLAWSLSVHKNSEFKWKQEGCNQFETMASDIAVVILDNMCLKTHSKALPQVNFKIIAYDSKLDIVYLWYDGFVSSYQLGKREVNFVTLFDSSDCLLAYRHTFAPIQTCNEVKGKLEEKVKKENAETIEKDDELASAYENCCVNKGKVKPRRGKVKKGKLEEKVNKKKEDLPEMIEKDDELASTYENCSANKAKVKPRRGKAKIDFNLLQLEEE